MTQIEKKLGYTFKNTGLLQTALTHTSFANEQPGCLSNERLEFLGDSLLGFLTTKILYDRYPEKSEGQLTRLRATLVCESSLAAIAEKLAIGNSLRMGRGEAAGGGHSRPSTSSDAVEALLAAMFFDGGIDICEKFVLEYVLPNSAVAFAEDTKTALQEKSQRINKEAPVYRLVEEAGPDHQKLYTVEVLICSKVVGRGQGSSKKLAEQAAAGQALQVMDL